MRRPPSAVSSMSASGSMPISMRYVGVSISSFIRSMRLVPPAMNLAVGSRAADAHAEVKPANQLMR
jgi:hypothetical protein